MCGLAGIFSPSEEAHEKYSASIDRMLRALIHRGPDSNGTFKDARHGLHLGHSRLSILDLTQNGTQPMISPSSNLIMVFNGEIYNFREIRRDLEKRGYKFISSSDSEVALAAFEEYGVIEATSKFVGMFAFAVYDFSSREIYLIRDRLGIKPLYYSVEGAALLFASELKSLKTSGLLSERIDRASITSFLRLGYIPQPHSIYENVKQVPQGSVLRIKFINNLIQISQDVYWDSKIVPNFSRSKEEYVQDLRSALIEAVNIRMIADVPLGVLLSGGIDSSLVAALAQSQNGSTIKTFCMGFDDDFYNEANKAKIIAKYLNTDHHELYITESHALELVPSLVDVFDEPFADTSQIPTLLLSKYVRSSVTVALSGDGGDELFCGYSHYFSTQKMLKLKRFFPEASIDVLRCAMRLLPPNLIDRLWGLYVRDKSFGVYPREYSSRIKDLLELLKVKTARELYKEKQSIIPECEELLLSPECEVTTHLDTDELWGARSPFDSMMDIDRSLYLPSDILTKVDRASMRHSLEIRVPLLDHRVVELANEMPIDYKVSSDHGKVPLTEILSSYIPVELFQQKKSGFGVPIERWLKGPLKPWSDHLLSDSAIRRHQILDVQAVSQLKKQFESGRLANPKKIWNILMLQAWCEGSGVS